MLSRRSFLTKSSIAIAGTLLVGDAALEAFERLTHRKVFALGGLPRQLIWNLGAHHFEASETEMSGRAKLIMAEQGLRAKEVRIGTSWITSRAYISLEDAQRRPPGFELAFGDLNA